MSSIRYFSLEGRTLLSDIKASPLTESISDLVSRSFKHANSISRVYSEQAQEAFLDYYSPQNIRELHNPMFGVFAFDGGKLVGVGFLEKFEANNTAANHVENGKVLLYGMYVDPDYQRKGYHLGSQILTKLIEHAKSKNMRTIIAHSTKFPGVVDFYKISDFEELCDIEFGEGENKRAFRELRLNLSTPTNYNGGSK